MVDFLMAWIWSYNAMFVAGCVLGFIVGVGARDLWLIRHPDERVVADVASAAYEDEPQTDHDAVARRLLNY
jgi:hypothetical protein